MKHKPLIIALIIAFALLVVLGVYSILSSGYAIALYANWKIDFSFLRDCDAISTHNSVPSFHGDGPRFHSFSCRNEKELEAAFEWTNAEHTSKYFTRLDDAVENLLDELCVPAEERPTYENCLYWYTSKNKYDELFVLWDRNTKMLYIAEDFL